MSEKESDFKGRDRLRFSMNLNDCCKTSAYFDMT